MYLYENLAVPCQNTFPTTRHFHWFSESPTLLTIIEPLLQNRTFLKHSPCGLNYDSFDLVLVLVFLSSNMNFSTFVTYCGEVDRAWKSGFWGHSVNWDVVATWGCPKNLDILWCIKIKYTPDSKPNRQVMSEQESIESIDQNAWHEFKLCLMHQ